MQFRETRLNTHFVGLGIRVGILLLLTLLLMPQVTAHAQVTSLAQVPCNSTSCDNTDPYGQCLSITADGGCTNSYSNSTTAATGSCESLGTRLAVSQIANRSIALKVITTSTGEAIATAMLMYSDPCQTNWVNVILQGRCSVNASHQTPCSISGDMSRTERSQRDGDAFPVTFLPSDPSGSAHTAMLYAPDVAVQACVSVTYSDGSSNIPIVCLTQTGW